MGRAVSHCALVLYVHSIDSIDRFDDGKLIENLNDTSSLTYESYKSTATSK